MLKIYVTGTAGSGKTTVSAIIAEALAKHGIDSTVVPAIPDELPKGYNPLQDIDQKADSIKRMNGTIEILESRAVRGNYDK